MIHAPPSLCSRPMILIQFHHRRRRSSHALTAVLLIVWSSARR